MDKLIELLNEYGTQKKANANWKEFLEEEKNQIYLIFGMDFIKWLVENDKIDIEKLEEKAERKPHYIFTTDDGRLGFKLFEVYESLLMLLSISDTPIDFLCEILK